MYIFATGAIGTGCGLLDANQYIDPRKGIVNPQREAQLLEYLRLAEKMVNYVCEYSQIKSELNKNTVFSAATRAKAALRDAKKIIEQKDDPADPPAV